MASQDVVAKRSACIYNINHVIGFIKDITASILTNMLHHIKTIVAGTGMQNIYGLMIVIAIRFVSVRGQPVSGA